MTNRLPQKRFLWALAAVGTVCGAALLFNEPTDIRASDGENAASDLAMFAVESQGGELIRYDPGDGTRRSLGAVTSPAGDIFYGIKALAHIPGHANLIGMWTDPADGEAKLIYVHSVTARGMIVGQPMGTGEVTGATTIRSNTNGGHEIYAIHTDSDGRPGQGLGTLVSHLVKVNHQTGEVIPVATLDRVYKSLAAASETRFYAVSQNKLYVIDLEAGTETELGTSKFDHLAGLEMFGRHLLGYASNAGRFVEVGQADSSIIGSELTVGVNQVEAMTILQISNLPHTSYD